MNISSFKKGFTLIELLVSLAIFAFMTAFLLTKYGTFNQTTLLTDLAYDTALTIRSAQSYGLNVQNVINGQGTSVTCSGQVGYTSGNSCFYYAYGVHFGGTTPTNQFLLFVDLNAATPGLYSSSYSPSEIISTYNMNTGYTIKSICAGTAASCIYLSSLDITFKRPNPDAIIDGTQLGGPGGGTAGNQMSNVSYAKIVLTSNGVTKSVVVQSTGEISITN